MCICDSDLLQNPQIVPVKVLRASTRVEGLGQLCEVSLMWYEVNVVLQVLWMLCSTHTSHGCLQQELTPLSACTVTN